jgi:hypothetical protein
VFKKPSVFMMLLLGTGSLLGVISIYQPVDVETQPQPQPQIPGSKIIVPGLPKQQQPTIAQQQQRALEDKQLLDRLMPEIIKRIDVKLVLTQRPGQIGLVKSTLDPTGNALEAKARCQPGETAVSAGFYAASSGTVYYVKRDNPNERDVRYTDPNAWTMRSWHDGDGRLSTYVECLKVQLSLRPLTALQQNPLAYLQEIPQPPAKPQPPSQPPGGPPLQPPPEFGKK